MLGHELSARVLEVADDVSSVSVGDRVSVQPLIFCGECYFCRRGLNHLCVQMACVGLSFDGGGISEQLVLDASQVSVLPDTVSDEQGALIEPSAVAAYGVDRTGFTAGDSILITGAGPIGALSALYAHVAGASQIIISEPNPKRRALAASFGIATILDPHVRRRHHGGQGHDGRRRRRRGRGVLGGVRTWPERGVERRTLARHRHPGGGVARQARILRSDEPVQPRSEPDRNVVLPGHGLAADHRAGGVGRFPVEKAVSDVVPVADIVERGFDRLLDPNGDAQKILVEV